ncbi:MAG: plastocyanin/azurin family copper-binding protein [Gemmatimonadales bacterium]
MLTSTLRLELAMLAAVFLAAGCGSNSGGDVTGPPATGNTVSATPNLTFTPATLTVNAGDVVTFRFGSVAHNVFFAMQANVPADIPGTNANVSVERTFTTAGTYGYECHIHPSMHGTVMVR